MGRDKGNSKWGKVYVEAQRKQSAVSVRCVKSTDLNQYELWSQTAQVQVSAT